jgi:hypothetical protein
MNGSVDPRGAPPRSGAPDPTTGALSAALEAALLRELRAVYEWENDARFGGRLRTPLIVLSSAQSRLGRWDPDRRVLELSTPLVIERPWPEVVSVLTHEMAHQFVDEVLEVRDETAHGATFRRVCAERGIDARAAGEVAQAPRGGAPGPGMTAPEPNRTLDRIRKLLALAGSPNAHEAEAAMRKAHELMLRHNVAETEARSAEAGAGADVRATFVVRHLGDPSRRRTRVEDDIVGLLTEHFFVQAIRIPVYLPLEARRGWVFEILGTEANVAMAAHVFSFLLATAERLWLAARREGVVRSGRERLSFQSGVVRGFREKLREQRTALRGTGLVWRGDAALDAFYRRRHPRVERRKTRLRFGEAHEAGRAAGRRVTLHRPLEGTSTGAVYVGPRRLGR